MDRIIETLERYYRSLDQERDWDFFLNLADYVNLLKELPIQDVVEKIKEGEGQIREDLAKQEALAVAELRELKDAILKKVHASKELRKSKLVQEAIVNLNDLEEGKKSPNHYTSSRIESGLDGIIRVLEEKREEHILKDLFPDKKESERVYIYQFSAALISRQGLSTIYSEKAKTELWGAYRKLLLVPNTIFDGKKRLAELERKGEENEDIKKLVEEMDIIKSNSIPSHDYMVHSMVMFPGSSGRKESEKHFSSSSDERIHEFRRDDYNTYATRFHNYLLKEMSREKATPSVQSKNGFSFDGGILSYQGKEIVVSKTKNSRPYFLLKTILKNPKGLWNYDELWQDLFSTDYEPKKWKQIYNAAHDLNEKIAIVTGVSDFLELSKTTIKINQKYT